MTCIQMCKRQLQDVYMAIRRRPFVHLLTAYDSVAQPAGHGTGSYMCQYMVTLNKWGYDDKRRPRIHDFGFIAGHELWTIVGFVLGSVYLNEIEFL